ncbi:cytochrome P450 [Aaosphaeria arxii CBS 175.79]|uniref:Cytochrome P450 n=1 Tax=Aaosphaeria arxii CBS 175.79 TaxID=1450172 RepID=A0A6A5XH75_9PLEO|nr:cytochrome P450 [Aaosphaeria arxii CBS 175.79]KAF2012229.1 cytochrome P450 [Aaosphaeria arxii CBS 175.79]
MALRLVLTAVVVIVLYNVLARYRRLARNISEAKASGLPYVITLWNVYSMFWLATNAIWLPLLHKLPSFCKGLWLQILDPEWAYRFGHEPFQKIGSDVFLVVSPYKINAFVADAETNTQITTRRNDFPKPLDMYGALDIYGKNLVSTEGSDWRMHRKLTAPAFSEKNNELVFVESLHHAKSLLRLWTGADGKGDTTITDPALDTMRFALYVVSRAGFDVRVFWPHEEEARANGQFAEEKTDTNSLSVTSEVPEGHSMNYREAISELLENMMWTQIIPPKYLPMSPFKLHRTVGQSVKEWGQYMSEMYELKKTQVLSGNTSVDGMDLFLSLIRHSNILTDTNSRFAKSDLLGNAFVILLAGHETTANAIHFSLLFLAMNPSCQRRLQQDIDRILKGRNPQDLSYEDDFSKLFDGMPAAVMNETLRMFQPVVNIPKSTAAGSPQRFTMDGKQYTMPGGVYIHLSGAVHRNPKYWAAPASNTSSNDTFPSKYPDIDTFRPERWLTGSTKPQAESTPDDNIDGDLRGPPGDEPTSRLFKPVKGSYIPFSDGYRSCIGRRFAQTEILAALVVIFSQNSVELAVDEFASDEEVERMPVGGEERKAVYEKAIDGAEYLLRNTMGSVITLQLRGKKIPIRVVRRGEERFSFA